MKVHAIFIFSIGVGLGIVGIISFFMWEKNYDNRFILGGFCFLLAAAGVILVSRALFKDIDRLNFVVQECTKLEDEISKLRKELESIRNK